LLYKQLKIPVPTIATKYKSGDYSVSKDDLEVCGEREGGGDLCLICELQVCMGKF